MQGKSAGIRASAGVLYELMFSPADPEIEGYEGMLALYDTLTSSLTFLP